MSAPPGTSKNRSGNIRTGKTRSRKWFSLLTLRIWVIVIFPLAMFYIGLIHLDQYRLTVINSQLDALYRQGDTLAITPFTVKTLTSPRAISRRSFRRSPVRRGA